MKINFEKLQEKVLPVANKVSANRYLKAVSDGISTLLPAIMIGSIFTLLGNIPIKSCDTFLTSIGLKQFLLIPINFTTNIIALLAVFFIAYRLAESFDVKGSVPGLLATVCFLIITPVGQIKGKDFITEYISFDWLGAKGLFVAIIVGLIVTRLYVYIVQKGYIIKMPNGVAPAVSESFSGLIPGFVLITLFVMINAIFSITPFGNLHQFIFQFIQTPLLGLGGSFGAFVIAILLIGFLWMFGISGTMVVFSILYPIYMTLDLQNLAAYNAGSALPNIIGSRFFMCYVEIGGTGATLALAVIMAFMAKSKRYKTLGRLVFPTCCFEINEPILYGVPIVLNPILAIPFIVSPLLCGTIAYVATALGIVPRLMGVLVPWTTPPLINGLLQGSWKISALQVVLFIISALIYYPAFKILDKKACEEETSKTNSEVVSE